MLRQDMISCAAVLSNPDVGSSVGQPKNEMSLPRNMILGSVIS